MSGFFILVICLLGVKLLRWVLGGEDEEHDRQPQSSPVNNNTSSSSPKFPTSLSKSQQSSSVDPHSTFPKPPSTASSKSVYPPLDPSSSKPTQSINTSSSSPKTPTSLSQVQQSPSRILNLSQLSQSPSRILNLSQLPQSTLVSPSSSSFQPRTSLSNPPHSSSNPSPSCITSLSQLSQSTLVSPSTVPPISKSFLSHASSNAINEKGRRNYKLVQNDPLPIFVIPEDIKDLIKNDKAPKVLKQPLSPTTYKDYFAALLYAEELYYEKWPHFDLENVTLELHEAEIHKNEEKEERTFVAFQMDSFPENRPFLLSRDLVYVRPSGKYVEHFQGFIHRIVKSSLILVEFKDEFYVQHGSNRKYDVSFSFNRVCLKRAHQAVQTPSDALFRNFLFPDCVSRTSIPTAPAQLYTCHTLDPDQLSAVRHILSIQGSPPYLVAGQLCVERNVFRATRTGAVVSKAVLQLFQRSLENRILICAPSNRGCDWLMKSLLKAIPESDMFRANAAFREKDEVPDDILPSCLYQEPYFSCPPTEELRKFRVIFSTFMSSFRLHDKGLTAGHFSHIFLVDASSAIEPETMVTLTNFADNNTTVVVTGAQGNQPYWVRSDMARQNGLKISYFERLFHSYRSLSPMFITQLDR